LRGEGQPKTVTGGNRSSASQEAAFAAQRFSSRAASATLPDPLDQEGRMLRRLIPVVGALLLLGCLESSPTASVATRPSLSSTTSDGEGLVVFNTQLRAENEVPPRPAEAKGHAQITILENGDIEFMIIINNKDLQQHFMAHIHKAPEGSNGPIHWDLVFPSVPPFCTDEHCDVRGTAVPRAAADLTDLRQNPELYYVNVHSTTWPGGSMRGQLP
jgi:hypothetical protein